MSGAGWPVVAGIPILAEAPGGTEVQHWLPAGWRDSEPTEPAIEIEYVVGDTAGTGTRALVRSGRPDTGDYLVDAAGELAVRACDVPNDPPQLMTTLAAGRRYQVRYADRALIAPLQWRWPRNVFGFALASRRRGLVAHACAVKLASGAGVLVPGCSGDGKSTFGRTLSADATLGVTALSDDRVVVSTDPRGAIRLWGTPWHSSAHLSSPEHATLALIAFPARGGTPAVVRPLSRHAAARRLMRCLGYPVWSPALMSWALELTTAVVSCAPAVEIAYAPGPENARALHVHVEAAMEDMLSV